MLIRYPQHPIPLIPSAGSSSTFGVGLEELARTNDGWAYWVKGEWDAAAFAATAKQEPHGSQVSSVADRLSQSYVSNQPWREPAWHEVMRSVASVCWGNIVVWSLLGSLVTERTEWLGRKLSTTCLPSFINFRETFQELCFNPPFKDNQRDVKPCQA